MEPVDILTIAAHPDDVELTCSGTLLRMIHQGYSAGILDLTQGEMGTRGTPELRAKEAEAAATVIGARWRERMNLGDSGPPIRPRSSWLSGSGRRNLKPLSCPTGKGDTRTTTPRRRSVMRLAMRLD